MSLSQTIPCSVNLTYTTTPVTLSCNGGTVALTALGQGQASFLMNNDFNSGGLGAGWVSTGGAAVGTACGPSLDGTPYYWASTSTGTPNLTTSSLDVTCGGTVSFDMSYATQGGAAPCEGPDLPNEGVTFQYSTDGGATWTVISYWDPVGGNDPTLTSWNNYSFPIPPGAIGPNTQFQWIQNNSSGACCDNWGIDNVQIVSAANCAPYVYDYWHVPGGNDNPNQSVNITSTTTYNVTYTNGTDSCSTSVTVVVPPGTTADAGADQVFCFGAGSVTIGANPVTPDEGATYTWSTGATGTIDLTGGVQDNGQITVSPAVTTTYTLTVDFNGCTATDDVTVVVDVPPTGSNPANINVECAANVPAANVNVVTTEADDFTIPPTVTFVGDVSDLASCPETITRTYRITDGCGNFVDVIQLVIINDVTNPTGTAPAAAAYQCIADVPAQTNAQIGDEADNCSVPVVAMLAETQAGTCPITITRQWSITDACNNSIIVTQIITVNDTQNPTGTAPAAAAYQCLADVPAQTNAQIGDEVDNCSVPVVAMLAETQAGTCPITITRQWSITDACNNSITVTQVITVDDTQNPTATNPAPQVGAPPAFDPLQVTDEADNCGVPTVTDGGDVSDMGTCPEIITREYIITDACGNTISVFQTFTVGDAILPTASDPAGINIECAANVPVPDPTVVTDEADNGALPTVTWEDDNSDLGTCPEIITRRYRVTDDCGNFIFVQQLITINDVTDPLGTGPVDGVYQCIADVPLQVLADVTGVSDNCTAVPVVAMLAETQVGTCPIVITRQYTVTDDCGNQIILTQTITVDDTVDPVATAPVAGTYQCIADVPLQALTDVTGVSDNCTPAPVVAMLAETQVGTCPIVITRQYSVTDDCGN
ncbi:MAG: hypothetical protein COA33_003805, partial [Fluviicola sp.]|nr:hypothetical protein [Fluviicola sp.]